MKGCSWCVCMYVVYVMLCMIYMLYLRGGSSSSSGGSWQRRRWVPRTHLSTDPLGLGLG